MAERRVYNLVCTECGERFQASRHDAKTDTARCRRRRSDRIRRANSDAGKNKGLKQLGITKQERKDVVAEVVKEEVRPLVRENLGEEVQDAIKDLVALTPKVITVLEDALDGDDDLRKMQAAGIVARYTIGNKQLGDEASGKLEVHIGLPRPDTDGAASDTVPADVVELRVCEQCTEEKDAVEFDGNATRCRLCQDELKRQVLDGFGSVPEPVRPDDHADDQ